MFGSTTLDRKGSYLKVKFYRHKWSSNVTPRKFKKKWGIRRCYILTKNISESKGSKPCRKHEWFVHVTFTILKKSNLAFTKLYQ